MEEAKKGKGERQRSANEHMEEGYETKGACITTNRALRSILILHFHSIGYYKPPLSSAYHLVCVANC